LAAFASALSFEDIPDPVVRKIEDLLVDWFGSTVAPPGPASSFPAKTGNPYAKLASSPRPYWGYSYLFDSKWTKSA